MRRFAVIGAGNMGSGIAQKMASEGFRVALVDLDDERVARGRATIESTLAEGVERKIFRAEKAEKILANVEGTADWSRLADVDLVVEAVFEDFDVKRQVFARLDEICRPDAILGTNTSSFSVTRLAEGTKHPERIVGLHYFYHPAKNRLVEVVPGRETTDTVVREAWAVQEQLGKTPIASADVSGFIVNRYFVPWLNEAVRLLEDGIADIATIEQAAKTAFGVGMGPFQLMNVTGVPIALHAATTLGQEFGPFYGPSRRLMAQVESGDPWPLDGEADASRAATVSDRMLGAVYYVAASLVDEGVGTIEDTDIGARVGLRWPRGPFEMINRTGLESADALVRDVCTRWKLDRPTLLANQVRQAAPFAFRLIRRDDEDGVATLTINRPDAMNALNEEVVAQLHRAFRDAAADPDVNGVVIAGAGKAFVAGADIRFFVRNIEKKTIDRIVAFTEAGHALLNDIAACAKPVIARVDGLTLGGGLELALACDRIIATPGATLAFPETGIGIYPGLGGTQRTTRRIGVGLTKWLVFTGDMLDAATACEIGLVDRVVPHAELAGAIRAEIGRPVESKERPAPKAFAGLASLFEGASVDELIAGKVDPGGNERIAKSLKRVTHKAPIALEIASSLIERGAGSTLEEGLRMELSQLERIFGTEDAYEGLSKLGRGRPEFRGR